MIVISMMMVMKEAFATPNSNHTSLGLRFILVVSVQDEGFTNEPDSLREMLNAIGTKPLQKSVNSHCKHGSKASTR